MDPKEKEHLNRLLNRPYYYGYAMRGKTIFAYTKEEWGIGASSGGGDYNLIRSFYFSLALTILMAPVALGCLILAFVLLINLQITALIMAFFGLIFGFALLQCYFNVKEEWLGRKARKLKGLPKPWWKASDDQAYEWFLTHPSPHIHMTLEYFPDSVKLRQITDNTAGN